MTKKKILIISICLILLTVTAVSAHENTTETISIDNTTATFSDLQIEIANTEEGGVLNLTKDYRYDSGDNSEITINKSLTINGNNHVLDGNSQSRIFTQNKGKLILNDLIFKNGNSAQGGAIFSSSPLTLNNVVFKSNTASEGGALYIHRSLIASNTVFDENHAKDGAAIYMNYMPPSIGETDDTIESISIRNSTFKNSHNISKGLIYIALASPVEIIGSTFENSTSDYGTAIFSRIGADFTIKDSLFENLHSTGSGGAFMFEMVSEITIQNSKFINTSSDATGGAIYAMLREYTFEIDFPITVKSSEFRDSKAKIGGAIAVTGGELTVQDSIFDNNTAITGGAIATVDCQEIIKNSTFTNNKLDTSRFEGNGGAIYAFSRKINIDNSKFINNTVNAIYCAENQITVTNSYFKNNTHAIESAYDKKRTFKNNEYNTDKLNLNNTKNYYVLIINSTGLPLTLFNDTMDYTVLPSYYNSRDYGWTTSIKDQGTSGACWVFATCASVETALLKRTGIELDLSEQNIHKNLMSHSKYGDSIITNGGFEHVAAEYLLSWYGPLPEEYDLFDEFGTMTIPIISNETVHIQDVIWLNPNTNNNYINEYKQAILKYGSIATAIGIDYTAPSFNQNTSALYNTKNAGTNHAISVVGWDDSYSKSNFLKTPPKDGAWIVKNSYGPDNYDEGYIYVSYYDISIGTDKRSIAYPIENVENYHKNYQTDIGGNIQIKSRTEGYTYKNIYKSIEDDVICAVGTYFSKTNEAYTLKVYVNNKLRHTQTGKAPFKGFHTVKLTKTIGIKKGDTFTVVMEKSSIPLLKESMQHFQRKTSYYNYGKGWIDLATIGTTASLKVYTKATGNLTTGIDPYTKNVEYKSSGYVTVTVNDIYGNGLKDFNVSVTLPTGEVKNMTTNSKGQIKFKISTSQIKTLNVKITTPAFGDYVKTTSTLKVKVTKITTKMTAAKSKTFKVKTKTKKIKVTLKYSNKALKKAKITIKVKGKTYSAKTNSKGVAVLKITKLTKKGTFKATIKYAGNKYYKAVQKTIKIKTK